ncbi:hypothetical protein ORI20_07915 [Mycobacterium sp. CVI_P3]|uniref:Uncharacterized protein n=1 Tax=Mycobacterium pinniadriaticum TaxID=2994102 RepID=A0ABT3SCX3_9MYCO|nr:hypothetical protein [Mycobacterium pinniadriaticum]MCX2930196.1 hypothetical protein [Mycobacterium pinniadriaticum]MCX2936742.1 hypothetical protein [Mycobacterium pinniadriaticum]
MSLTPDAATSSVVEDVGASTLRAGVGFVAVSAFVWCDALADLAVPEDGPCDDADDESADAVGMTPHIAAPTPSVTANPPT